ncbi:MAG TPA: chemotaxis protein CheX [Syntrophales bacterium]|nr:chemotaxis protein CheX [Syntrophales bacterium]
MDVRYINPFLNGTIEVLRKMAFVEPTPGKPYVKKDETAEGDVSGIIGITGDAIGSLAISFSEDCICSVVNSMLGENFREINKDIFDAVGEVTNMISGVARTFLEKDGLIVYAAIPTVVYGRKHYIRHILNSPSIVIPFSTEGGGFFVDVCIRLETAEDVQRRERFNPLLNGTFTEVETKGAAVAVPPSAPPPAAAPREVPPAAPPAPEPRKVPQDPKEKLEFYKTLLAENVAARDAILKKMQESPFMDVEKRRQIKRVLPAYDAKIKRLKLDIAALQMISGMSKDDLENPKLVRHFQHYDDRKRK